MESPPGGDATCAELMTKDFKHYINLADKAVVGLRGMIQF